MTNELPARPAMDLGNRDAIILPGDVVAIVHWAITSGNVTTVDTSSGTYRYYPMQPVPIIID